MGMPVHGQAGRRNANEVGFVRRGIGTLAPRLAKMARVVGF